MEDRRVVVLYGSSLFVAGLETCLRNHPEMEVVRINAGTPDAREHLKSLYPDVIVFDSGDDNLGDLPGTTQLTRDNPGALIIGLDDASNSVMLLSSQQQRVTKAEDIVEAIRKVSTRSEM